MTETPMPPTAHMPLDQIATALAGFQGEMPTVAKAHTATVKSDKGSYSYTYAGLADVSEAAMPLLARHGLSFTTLPGHGVLTGMLLHSSGQSLTASLPIANGTPQQVGSALTYMRRYLLGCMTGLVTDDDDDGRQAETVAKRPRPKAPARPTSERPAGGPTPPQLTKIGASMSERGWDRDQALRFVAYVVGRPVASRNDLTVKEASDVIEALEAGVALPESADS
jgi:hypothetical protein